MSEFVLGFNVAFLTYVVVINITHFSLVFISFFAVITYRNSVEHHRWRRDLQSPLPLGASVIVPAYNEALSIEDSVQSFLHLEYPLFEIIVVNDGSTDNTLDVLSATFGLQQIPLGLVDSLPSQPILGLYRSPEHPRLIVVDKLNGGKADGLNAGINVASYPLVCAVDADSILEGGALLRVAKPFLDGPSHTAVVGGIIRVANGCVIKSGRVVEVGLARSFLALIQTVEYLRAFLFGRSGLAAIDSLLIVSGAFGVFRKDIVTTVGGYRLDTVGEDIEIVIRIHRYFRDRGQHYKVLFLPDPICWTQVPESRRVLAGQRARWHRGLIHTLSIHRRLLLNPRYGSVGMIAFPYFFFVEMLRPIVELLGYVSVTASFFAGGINVVLFGLYLTLAIMAGATLSTGAILLEELAFRKYPGMVGLLKLITIGFVESFGYRQLNLWWRLKGTWEYMRGKNQWGCMERTGFGGG